MDLFVVLFLNFLYLNPVFQILKRKFKQWRSSILSISTKQTITFHLNLCHWTKKKTTTYDVGNPSPGTDNYKRLLSSAIEEVKYRNQLLLHIINICFDNEMKKKISTASKRFQKITGKSQNQMQNGYPKNIKLHDRSFSLLSSCGVKPVLCAQKLVTVNFNLNSMCCIIYFNCRTTFKKSVIILFLACSIFDDMNDYRSLECILRTWVYNKDA